MSFSLNQSGDVQRRSFELSVADFRNRASAGWSFWRGLAIGLASGIAICYGVLKGVLGPLL